MSPAPQERIGKRLVQELKRRMDKEVFAGVTSYVFEDEGLTKGNLPRRKTLLTKELFFRTLPEETSNERKKEFWSNMQEMEDEHQADAVQRLFGESSI